MRQLRALVGPRPVNWVGVCALVLNHSGEVLLQRRTDTGGWGTLGGLCELGERLDDALRREVQEEAGIRVLQAELLTVVSGPETFVRLPNGDEFYQYAAVYRVSDWTGTPMADGDEGSELRFFAPERLPQGLGPVDRQALALLR
ncbi:NUDIX hydrolase [Deinococcus sonorensis]|uniref:NUDIX hydrolase n=1 Tax=Deinococcus sonorensis TaxID=309891 RepID=A0ABV8Y2U8_9DEIO